MKTKLSLIIVCLLLSIDVNAQFIDSNKETVFQLDKAESSQIKLNGNEVSFEGNYLRLLRIFTKKEDIDKEDKTTSVKADVISFRIGLVNTAKILDVDDFNINDYGLSLQISHKWTIKDTIYNQSGAWTGAFGVKYQIDRFDLYNPNTQLITDETPSELSIIGNATKYFNSYKWAIALTGTYNIVTYNKLALTNFKENSGLTQDTNVVAFKSFDGKYGTLDQNLSGARLSIAAPFFFTNRIFNWKRMPYLTPTPYYSTILTQDLKPVHNIGVSLNLLESKPFNNTLFSLPSSVGIGIDWAHTNDNWSKANIFLSGSITLK